MKHNRSFGTMIDWVNSIGLTSCRLVSCIEDLQSGIVLCDILAYIKSRPLFPSVRRHHEIISDPERASLHNFSVFYQEIGKVIPKSLRFSERSLYEDVAKVIHLLNYLKTLMTPEKVYRSQSICNTPRNKKRRNSCSASFETAPSFGDNERLLIAFNWLKSLNFVDDPSTFIDHMRNGVVICKLINRLEGKTEVIKGIHINPRHNSAVQSNVKKALSYIHTLEKIDNRLAWTPEDIINGNSEVILSILLGLKQYYSVTDTPNVPVENIRKWVQKLGLGFYLDCVINNTMGNPLFNGVLLAEIMMKIEGIRIPGIVYQPTSAFQVKENIEACLNIHKQLATKHKKNLENIINGDENSAWSLLFSAMNFYSQGNNKVLENALVEWVNSLKFNFQSFNDLRLSMKKGVVLCDIVSHILHMPIPEVKRLPQTSKAMLGNIQRALDILKNRPKMPTTFLDRSLEILKGDYKSIIGLLQDLKDFSMEYDDMYAMTRMPSVEPSPSVITARRNPSQNFDWIYAVVNVPSFNCQGELILEFKSGALLCQLIAKLERTEIPAVENNPKTNAGALRNIEKALKILRTKPTFPSNLFFIEDQIIQGNGCVIRNLLANIYQIYKNSIHNRCKYKYTNSNEYSPIQNNW